jgi:hypothetical protein
VVRDAGGREDVMPFEKVSADDYVSPSGRHYTARQVRAYYASDGWQRAPHVKTTLRAIHERAQKGGKR